MRGEIDCNASCAVISHVICVTLNLVCQVLKRIFNVTLTVCCWSALCQDSLACVCGSNSNDHDGSRGCLMLLDGEIQVFVLADV